MLEIAGPLLDSLDRGRSVAVATVVSIEGSAPRGLGASMAWDGSVAIGSVAGGCVEGAVLDVLEQVLADGRVREIEFGIPESGSDAERALAVGLSCGGRLRFHLAVLDPDHRAGDALRRARAGLPARVALTSTGVEPGECPGAFVDEAVPPTRLLITGAMAFSAALSAAAQTLGWRVTVIDPRSTFLTSERFPGAEIVVEWPPEYLARTAALLGPRDVVCLLSHDDRYDAEALHWALDSDAGYVGAMGSRLTDERRRKALRALGIAEERLARLHSPIGLDLGAITPEETAISILAEVIREREGGSGLSLTGTRGSIHRTQQVVQEAG